MPSTRPRTRLLPDLTTIATTSRASSAGQSAAMAAGSRSIPTETKNRTANRSRNGVISPAAWCDSSDSLTISPATNAPSARDRPNTADDRKAASSAVANTDSRNSSGDPSRLTVRNSHGSMRVPTTYASPRNSAVRSNVSSTGPARSPPSANGSRSAIRRIVTRSWTTIQPTAVRPWRLSSSPRSWSTLSTTTVELMATAAPTTTAPVALSPSGIPTSAPATAVMSTWRIAPGTATRRTGASSRSENSTPSANSSSTTPISASSLMLPASPTKPGVNGPMTTPASR